MFAQAPQGKGKGGPPKNLKVLTPENLMDNMRSFVPALGLADKGGCNFCHEMDRSSDAKQEKVMARMMIHDGQRHQLQVPGRQGTRRLLHVPSRQHRAADGAAG